MTSPDSLSRGIYFFTSGDYAQSNQTLTGVLQTDSTNITARFYRGLSEMGLSEFGLAARDFRFVIDRNFSYYQEHCRWYLGLCDLKRGDFDEAFDQFSDLTQQKSVYNERATKILHTLSKYKTK